MHPLFPLLPTFKTVQLTHTRQRHFLRLPFSNVLRQCATCAFPLRLPSRSSNVSRVGIERSWRKGKTRETVCFGVAFRQSDDQRTHERNLETHGMERSDESTRTRLKRHCNTLKGLIFIYTCRYVWIRVDRTRIQNFTGTFANIRKIEFRIRPETTRVPKA